MATANVLTFFEVDGAYQCEFNSPGTCVVEIMRKDQGRLEIAACIDGMNWVGVKKIITPFPSKDLLFELALPSGISVRLRSDVEILQAKYLS